MAEALARMPLHDITETIGTEGLRERFAIEVDRLPAEVRPRLCDAEALASHLHRDDRRTREPYVNHLLRVAIRVMHHYRVDDADVICAALLHDSVEDHPFELGGLVEGAATVAEARSAALSELSRRYSDRVARLVEAVTNPLYDERDTFEQYREHVVASLDDDPWARVIKLSDFTDNAVGIDYTAPGKARRVAPKYQPLVEELRELAARPDTPLADDVKQHIDEQLVLADLRLGRLISPGPAIPNGSSDPA